MSENVVETALVPLAAELVATIRDYGRDDWQAVLSRVPDDARDDMVFVLAAMVDADKTPSQLLAWTKKPVQSRDGNAREETVHGKSGKSRRLPREHGSARGYRQHVARDDMPACKRCSAANRAMEARRYADRKATGKASRRTLEKAS
jgi:hypothetical protein